MRKQYGSHKAKKVFYASKNKGTIKGVDMPKVGGKQFGYGAKGKKAAKKYAKKHGLKVKKKKNPGYYAENNVASRINNLLAKLNEHQFRRGMSPEEGKKRGEEAKEGVATETERREAFKTKPSERSPRQKRVQRGSRRRYQRTGKSIFKAPGGGRRERAVQAAMQGVHLGRRLGGRGRRER